MDAATPPHLGERQGNEPPTHPPSPHAPRTQGTPEATLEAPARPGLGPFRSPRRGSRHKGTLKRLGRGPPAPTPGAVEGPQRGVVQRGTPRPGLTPIRAVALRREGPAPALGPPLLGRPVGPPSPSGPFPVGAPSLGPLGGGRASPARGRGPEGEGGPTQTGDEGVRQDHLEGRGGASGRAGRLLGLEGEAMAQGGEEGVSGPGVGFPRGFPLATPGVPTVQGLTVEPLAQGGKEDLLGHPPRHRPPRRPPEPRPRSLNPRDEDGTGLPKRFEGLP